MMGSNMFELPAPITLLRTKVSAILYFALAVALAVIAWYHYVLGHYEQILWPAFACPALLTISVIAFFQSEDNSQLTAYPALIVLSAVLLSSTPMIDPLYRQWLYIMPVLVCFVLPVKPASLVLTLLLALLLLRIDLDSTIILLDFLVNFALFSGISLIFAHAQESQTRTLEQLSGKDSLTSAFTASHLTQRLEAEVARAKATVRPLSVLQISLKELDEYSSQNSEAHARKFLVKLSDTIRQVCRTGDELYRVQDACFLVLLPNTSTNGGIVLKERMTQHIYEQTDLENSLIEIHLHPVTLQEDENAEQFLARALHRAETSLQGL